MNTLRKISLSVLALVMAFSVAGFTKISFAAAPDMSLVKGPSSTAVYYLKNNKRFVFVNEKTYKTWYADFSGVMTISQSELESYPLGGNVTYRPATNLVKITTSPDVYAVGYGRTLHKIPSEAAAIELYGANWAKMVQDLPDAFATNYVTGTPLVAGKYPEGALLKMAGNSMIVYYDGTSYRQIASETAFNANRFNFNYVTTVPSTWTSFSPMGSQITGVEASMVDTSGSATSSASVGTGLSVALASDTPASTSVPKGATRVNYTKFNVTASNDGDIVLQSVTVTRMGVGTPSDFDNVYLYDGMNRLTTGRSINSSTNKATFNNLNLTIAKGTTKALWIAADMAAGGTGSGSSSLGIASASDVTAGGAAVSGSFPISGNMMGMTNVSAGSITIETNGTLTNPKAGELGVKIASFRLTAGSAEDLSVKSLMLYNTGNISADKLSNFVLKQAGTTVATASAMSSNSNIMLNFTTAYMMMKGDSRNFDLYADISGAARSGDTIKLYLDNSADLNAIGQTYGFGVSVDRTLYNGAGGNLSSTTVQAGQVTLSFQGPSVKDIAVQQQDVELFRFTITAQSNIEIRNTHLNIAAGGTITANSGLVNTTGTAAANYKDIKFTDVTSNQLVAGPKDVATGGNDATQTLDYNDTWNVNAGQTRTIKVTADVANFTPAGNETIQATLNAFVPTTDVKNLDTNQFLQTGDIVPSGAIAGNTHRVKAGSLTLSLAGTPSVQTYINGASGVKMVGVNMAAGTGKDLKVTSIKLTATGASSCTTESDCVLNVKLWDGATQVGQTKSLANDNTVTFDNLNFAITKGTTKTLVATVDLNTLGTVAGGTNLHLDVIANGDVVAQDNDGNSVTASGATVTGPTQVISGAGSITMATAPVVNGSTDSRLVVAGATDQTIMEARFTAANEDLKASKLRVRVRGTAAGDSAINEIDSVALYNGATRITDWVVPSSVVDTGVTYATADFNTFTSDFIVLKDASKTLSVRVNYKTVSAGARAGQNLTASIDGGDNFEFRGTNSNTVLTTGSDVTGATVYIYKSKPTVTNVALANSVLTGGNQTIAKFSVTADAAGVVDWRKIVFTSTSNSASVVGDLTNITLVDESNQTLTGTTCSLTAGTGTVTQTLSCVSTGDQQVSGTKVYSLKADVTLLTGGYASLSTRIAQPSAYAAPAIYTTVAATSATFVWSDENIVGHTTSSADYNNSFLVRELPTDSQTLVKTN